MQPSDYKIVEFPQDDQEWWIRWIDDYYVTGSRTATPQLTVYLDKVGPNDKSTSSLIKRNWTEVRAIKLHTSLTPLLSIGQIYKNGRLIRDIATFLHSLSLDLEQQAPLLLQSSETIAAPEAWHKDMPYRVLNRSEYPMGRLLSSHCVLLKDEEKTLVIPCQEIFKAYYAPASAFALAFTEGPWQLTMSKIIDSELTGIKEDGSWKVYLQERIIDDHAPWAANLTLNPYGLQQAKSIYTQFVKQNAGQPTKPSKLKINFPFNRGKLAMQVRLIKLSSFTNKYLVSRIVATDWSQQNVPSIELDRKNNNSSGLDKELVDLPKPYVTVKNKSRVREFEDPNITSAEDPEFNTQTTEYRCNTMRWINPPIIIKPKKDKSYIYTKPHIDPDEDSNSRDSTGNPTNKESEASKGTVVGTPYRDASQRFQQVVSMFSAMEQEKKIGSFQVRMPSRTCEYRGSLPVWPFPVTYISKSLFSRKIFWSYLSREDLTKRTALVIDLMLDDIPITWIEIETRPSESGFRALLFTTNDYDANIPNILYLCALENGIWMNAEAEIMEQGVSKLGLGKHYYLKENTLNPESALNALRSLIANDTIDKAAEASH